MFKGQTIFCLAMIFGLAFAGTTVAQEADFFVVITDSEDPVEPNSSVNFEVEVANAGPEDSTLPVILDITLPMGVPVPFQEYLQADEDGRTAIVDMFLETAQFMVSDNIWDEGVSRILVGESLNNGCAGLMIQLQQLVLPASSSGVFFFDVTLPRGGGVAGVAYTRADGEQVVLNHGIGGCSDLFSGTCGDGDPDLGVPCMGPPLTWHTATGAPVFDTQSNGCEPLVVFPAGHIALIDRGVCNFSTKAHNATQAGASGVLIANTEGYGGSTPTDDSVMQMGCSDAICHSLTITIPAAFISYNDGAALRGAMDEGDVSVFMGVRHEEPELRQTKAWIWDSFWIGGGFDTNPDNDRYTETTALGPMLFIDGFESGDTSAWGDTGSESFPLVPGTWQWLIDSQCSGSFVPYSLIFYPDGSFLSPERCSGFEDSWSQNQNTVEFSFSSCDGIYTGTLNSAGTFMSGTASWGGCWQATWMF